MVGWISGGVSSYDGGGRTVIDTGGGINVAGDIGGASELVYGGEYLVRKNNGIGIL